MALGNGLSSAHNYFVPIFHPSQISNLALWLEYNVGHTSENDETTVGVKAGPLTVGPTTTAPMSPIAAGKNEVSTSFVKTPGLTTFSAI